MSHQPSTLHTIPAAYVGHCNWCQDVQVVLAVPAGYRCLVCDRNHADPPLAVTPPVLPTTEAVDVWDVYYHQCDLHALAAALCAARGD